MIKQPLISICIPTYNRADVLSHVLDSIVKNKAFDNDIEVIISDNASTDNTPQIVSKYVTNYSNIKYFCNDTNVRDKNFWTALNRATGKYRKLQNDYLGYTEEGLSLMKKIVKNNQGRNIFFTDDKVFTKKYKGCESYYCSDINDYIKVVSTFVTYIPIFGCWEDDLVRIKDPFACSDLQLNQVDWTYQLFCMRKEALVVNSIIYENFGEKLKIRKGYNWFAVHVKNYYDIMEKYVKSNLIKNITVVEDKENCLYHFWNEFVYTYIYAPSWFKYDTQGTFKYLFKYMNKTKRFYLYYGILPFLYLLWPYFYAKYSDGRLHFLCVNLKKIILHKPSLKIPSESD